MTESPRAAKTHLADAVLCDYATGKLPEDRAHAVELHLSACHDCGKRLDAVLISRDPLVARLQAVSGWPEPSGEGACPLDDAGLVASPKLAESQGALASHPTEPLTGRNPKFDETPLEATSAFTPSASGGAATSASVGDKERQRFRIVRLHAEGGLGRVLLARDGDLHRDVALKEIKPKFADDEICRARFELEAQITGGLQHPGIVPVYAVGRHADGRPFYIMRFIRGQAFSEIITDYHNSVAKFKPTQPSVQFRSLVRRFLDVCLVIDFAHNHGVVHRDLKPANVMLGRYGETIVVDWGLAKSIDVVDTEQTFDDSFIRPVSSDSAATSMGSLMGTLGFMSPEQAAGDPRNIGRPADIYSLGATLYVILTGRAPHTGKSRDEVIEQILKGSFSKPRQLHPQAPRPLEAICLKAMALSPDDRYASARSLAEDVESWLADEPVCAYSETVYEQTTRWLRKNQAWAISGGSALAVASVVLLCAALLVNRARVETEQQRQLALDRYRDARQAVDTWLVQANDVLQYYPGVQAGREKLLETAAADLEKFAHAQSNDAELEIERAKVWLKLGDVRRSLNSRDTAKQAYATSESLIASLLSQKQGINSLGLETELARARLRLAGLMSGTDPVAAETLLEQEILRLQKLAQLPKIPLVLLEVLGAMQINRGSLLIDQGNLEVAGTLLEAAENQFERLLREEPKNVRYGKDAALIDSLLGKLQLEAGRADAARQRFSSAVQRQSALIEREPDNPAFLVARGNSYILLGNAYRQLGNFAREAQAYLTAIESYEQSVRAAPDVTEFRESLALTQIDLAQLQLLIGEPQLAVDTLQPARALLKEFIDRYPDEPRFQELLAAADDVAGEGLRELNDPDAMATLSDATERLSQIVEQFPNVADYRERLAVCQSHLAYCLFESDPERSRDLFDKSVTALELLAQHSPDLPRYRHDLATVLTRQVEALKRLEQEVESTEVAGHARRVWRSLVDDQADPEYLRQAAWFLANAPQPSVRDAEQAITLADRACDQSPGNRLTWLALGVAQARAERWQAAYAALDKARELAASPDPFGLAWLARVNFALGNLEEARRQLEEATELTGSKRPGNHELKDLLSEVKSQID